MICRDDRGTRIYRWFDADDVLLYIGVTNAVALRTYMHSSASAWFRWATRIEIDPRAFSAREDAEQYEQEMIEKELPIFNRDGADEWWIRQEAYLLLHGADVPIDVLQRSAGIHTVSSGRTGAATAARVRAKRDRMLGELSAAPGYVAWRVDDLRDALCRASAAVEAEDPVCAQGLRDAFDVITGTIGDGIMPKQEIGVDA